MAEVLHLLPARVIDSASINCASPGTRNTVLHKRAMQVALKVDMMCEGCAGSVKKILSKTDGVDSYDVDVAQKKVVVKGNFDTQACIDKLNQRGLKTERWA